MLVFTILFSLSIVGIVSTNAYSSPPNYNRLPEYIPSDGVQTRTVMFAMPGSWSNGIWNYYGGNVGLYWWGGQDNPDDYPTAYGHGWPGWKMKRSADIPNLYSTYVSIQAPNYIFSNFIDGGNDKSYPEYYASNQTADLQIEYFGQGDSDYYPKEFWDYLYDNYYDDFSVDSNYQIKKFGDYAANFFYNKWDDSIYQHIDNMVFVVDCNSSRARISPVSDKIGYDGAFYFYYGNGEFGIWPTREMCIEKEEIKLDKDGKVDFQNEALDEKNGFIIREHTDAYNQSLRDFVVFGNFTGKYWGEKLTNGKTGDCTWTLDNKILTISGNGAMGDIFNSGCPWGYEIENVIIKDGVTSISDGAFCGCSKLNSVLIPDSVISIGDFTFSYCSSDLDIYCSTVSYAKEFADKNGLKTVDYDFAIKICEDNTVELTEYFGKDTNVIIPNNIMGKTVKSLKNWLFANNTKIQSITIPDSVTKIGKGAFYNCVELKTVTMGSNVTEIGANAFEKCLYLESINLSDNLQTIGDEAFYDCRRLKKLDIPATVTSIGEEAFTNCRSLTSLTIPKGVDKIGDESSLGCGMFENCQNLTEVTIPKTVSYIQSNAFDGCKNLTILGSSNSYAKSYAENNNIKFRAIAEDMAVGDANGDNTVDILDAAAIQKHASGKVELKPEQFVAADVNGDGNVDVLDAAEIQKFAAGKITEFKKKA